MVVLPGTTIPVKSGGWTFTVIFSQKPQKKVVVFNGVFNKATEAKAAMRAFAKEVNDAIFRIAS